jgi:hypothetical protein
MAKMHDKMQRQDCGGLRITQAIVTQSRLMQEEFAFSGHMDSMEAFVH